MIARINKRRPDGGREGGVLWHTTGSGKSFTMVYLCKALLLHRRPARSAASSWSPTGSIWKAARPHLPQRAARSVRRSQQRKKARRPRRRSGRDLARRIGQGTERIVFTIIHKFNTASQLPECHNPSANLIVLVDEGHRSQGGENHERMRKALPNAAYIAFTGTPLLKRRQDDQQVRPIVHAYTMQRAVEDGTVTPLLYEERRPELDGEAKAIDNWFDRITAGLSDSAEDDLKKKCARKGAVYGSANRIELIAWDIAIALPREHQAAGPGPQGADRHRQQALCHPLQEASG